MSRLENRRFWRRPMSHKFFTVIGFVSGIIILLLLLAVPVQAQEPTPENDANCVACHEHRYYLYDTGKWYCLCQAPMHCVYCHGGRTDTAVEEEAHEGLVLYPTRAHAERCQTCHTEDYMSRVVTFETVAGVSSTPQTIITATPFDPAAVVIEEKPAPPLLQHLGQIGTGRQIGLGILAIVLAVLVIFGYRCWKADCLANKEPKSPTA